jgi:hypothetical protein
MLYAIRFVEGRIGIGFSVPSPEVHDKKYAFKCHRQTIDDIDHVWLVNASASQPVYVPYICTRLILHAHTTQSDTMHLHL